MKHFLSALKELTPAFGVAEDQLKIHIRGKLLDWGTEYRHIVHMHKTFIRQVYKSSSTPLFSVLIEGPAGTGKTALAAKLALESEFPYVKLITPENFVNSSAWDKVFSINQIFEDAYRSPLSFILIDNIERLLEYVPIGSQFCNSVLQCLMVLLKKLPPQEDRRLIILATTSNVKILKKMDLLNAFNVVTQMPELKTPTNVKSIFTTMNMNIDEKELDLLANKISLPITIKNVNPFFLFFSFCSFF